MLLDLPPEHPLSYIQIIGYIGMALGVFTFLQKDDVRLKLSMIAMTSVLIIHFVLLGRYVAAVSCLMSALRAGLSLIPFAMKHRHYFVALFVILSCLLGVYTYQSPIDVLPFITAVLGTFAFFYLSGIRMRIAFVVIGSIWLTHNILAQSYGPMVMEAFIMTANIITIIRLRADDKKAAG